MNRINDIKKIMKNNSDLIILLIIYFTFHLFIDINFGDDTSYFNGILEKMNVIEFINNRYNTHSSRLIIDLITVFIVQIPWVWKILDTLVFASIYYFIVRYTNNEEQKKRMPLILFLLYPFAEMSSAGWIATTINYSWVLLAILLSLIVIEKILQEKEIKWYNYAIVLLATFFASNHEQGAVVTLLLLILLSGYLWISKKQINYFVILQIFLTIIGIIFALTCPGNHVRKISDIQYWNPEFSNWGVAEKIYLSLLRVHKLFIAEENFIVLGFCIILLVAVILKSKKKIFRVAASIPLSIKIIYTFREAIAIWFQDIERIFNIPEEAVTVNWYSKSTYIPLLILFLFIGGVVIAIFEISEDMSHALLILSVLSVGVVSCLAMGFSPTLWASKSRTAIFMHFSLVYCASYIWSNYKELKENNKISNGIEILLGAICSLQVIDTICKVLKGPYPLG